MGGPHLIGRAGNPMSSKPTHTLRQAGILGDRHSAFTGGNDLDRMKAENDDIAVSAGTYLGIVPGRADGVRRILQYAKPIALTQIGDGAHVAALTREVHRHQDLGQFRLSLGQGEFPFQRLNGNIVGTWIDIHEIDIGAAVDSAIGRGDKCIRDRPQPVSRPQVQGQTCYVQARCRAADRNCVADTAVSLDGLLELRYHRTLCQPVRFKYPHDLRNVVLGNVLSSIGDQVMVSLAWAAAGIGCAADTQTRRPTASQLSPPPSARFTMSTSPNPMIMNGTQSISPAITIGAMSAVNSSVIAMQIAMPP